MVGGRKELVFASLSQALRSDVESWNQEGIPFSSQIVPGGLLVAEVS